MLALRTWLDDQPLVGPCAAGSCTGPEEWAVQGAQLLLQACPSRGTQGFLQRPARGARTGASEPTAQPGQPGWSPPPPGASPAMLRKRGYRSSREARQRGRHSTGDSRGRGSGASPAQHAGMPPATPGSWVAGVPQPYHWPQAGGWQPHAWSPPPAAPMGQQRAPLQGPFPGQQGPPARLPGQPHHTWQGGTALQHGSLPPQERGGWQPLYRPPQQQHSWQEQPRP